MKNVNVIVSVDGDIGFRAVIDLDAPKWNGFVNPKFDNEMVERIKEHCLDEMSECEFDQLVAENTEGNNYVGYNYFCWEIIAYI